MCFVFYQMCHYVSGQAGMKISKEEKRASESCSPLSTSAHTVKHPKMKFPLRKRTGIRIRFWLGRSRGTACGKTHSCFLLNGAVGSWVLVSFFFLSLKTETWDLGKHDIFF